MTKYLAFLLATQLPFLQAWAPVQTLPYSQLPKTLEFAEKVWFLPKPQDLSGPQRLPEEVERRALPWKTLAWPSEDRYFFDRYSGVVSEWPTRSAFLKSQKTTTTKLHSQAALDLDDYYDAMGNLVSWVASPEPSEEQQYYFSDMGGESRNWATLVADSKEKQKGSSVLKQDLSSLDKYYDAMGNLVNWSTTPVAEDHQHFFADMGGESSHWASLVAASVDQKKDISPAASEAVEQEPASMDYYYDDMGNLVSWVASPGNNKKEEEEQHHHYFQDVGGKSRHWASLVAAAAEKLATSTSAAVPKVEVNELSLENCEHAYYSDTGDLLCWVPQ